MNSTSLSLRFPRKLAICAAGAASGVLNGLLGTGGGIITVFFLTKLYARDKQYSTKDIFAMTVASSAIMSLSSVAFYLADGAFSLADCAPYVLPAIVGGVIGAILLDRLDSAVFKKIFSLLVIWAGISMMVKV